tara:strand:+ start:145 stop:1881 length:1737 start_codon:yes stop_codon:yes gene_type:complete
MSDIKKVDKVWGSEEWIVNRDYCGKILNLNKGFRCSIHHHKEKDETFYVLEGQVLLEVDGEKKVLNVGDKYLIEPGQKHRFTGIENSKILEFSTHHEDSDSYRDEPSGKMEFDHVIDKFSEKKILVIGDVMLDSYLQGNVSRVSPEAPIPVINVTDKKYKVGGAVNVASNVVSLGGSASIFGFVGEDREGQILRAMVEKEGIDCNFDLCGKTTVKTRVIGNNQQIARLDEENTEEKEFSSSMRSKLLDKAEEADAIIVSDYAKGTLTEDLFTLLQNYKSKIIVDPKPKNKSLYRDVFLITPNEKELFEMTNLTEFNECGRSLSKELSSHVLATRGAKGMTVFSDSFMEIPTYAKEIYDVVGAGDTVVATLALSISSGASLEESAIIANHAAGITVSKRGNHSVSQNELRNSISQSEERVVGLEELKRIVEEERNKGKKIVWTNGCFDLLHSGHVKYLKEAKKFGDVLIVGLNSDSSVKKLKGDGRPINSEKERAEIISSLGIVDYVLIFEEDTVVNQIKELRPDVYVKGGDYTQEMVNKEERRVMEELGTDIRIVSQQQGRSTTNVINKIKEDLRNDA